MFKKLLSSAGLQQSVLLTGGNFVATLFSALGLILISRTLGPTLFGEFTVGYSLMIILVRLQGIGLNVAIQKVAGRYFMEKNWQPALSSLLQVSTAINLALVIISTLLSVVIAWPLARLLHTDSVMLIWGSFIFASITLLFEYLTTVMQVMHRFAASVVMMLIQSVLKFLIGMGALWLGIRQVSPVFFAFYVTPLVAIVWGCLALPATVKLWPPKRDPQIEASLKKVLQHAVVLMATAGLIDYLDVLFVKRYTSPFETGIYGGISQLATAVMVVGYSLAAVLNARVARYHSQQHLQAYIKKAIGLAMVGVIGFLTYVPLAKLSILITIGAEYLPGLPYLYVLMLASFLVIATVPFMALFYSFDAHAYFSVSGLGQLAIVLFGGFVLVPEFGLTGAVWTKVASRVFLFLLTIIWAGYAYRRTYHATPAKVPS